jgi:hypothetical protein
MKRALGYFLNAGIGGADGVSYGGGEIRGASRDKGEFVRRDHPSDVFDRLAVASFDERAEAKLRTWLSDELLPRRPVRPVHS